MTPSIHKKNKYTIKGGSRYSKRRRSVSRRGGGKIKSMKVNFERWKKSTTINIDELRVLMNKKTSSGDIDELKILYLILNISDNSSFRDSDYINSIRYISKYFYEYIVTMKGSNNIEEYINGRIVAYVFLDEMDKKAQLQGIINHLPEVKRLNELLKRILQYSPDFTGQPNTNVQPLTELYPDLIDDPEEIIVYADEVIRPELEDKVNSLTEEVRELKILISNLNNKGINNDRILSRKNSNNQLVDDSNSDPILEKSPLDIYQKIYSEYKSLDKTGKKTMLRCLQTLFGNTGNALKLYANNEGINKYKGIFRDIQNNIDDEIIVTLLKMIYYDFDILKDISRVFHYLYPPFPNTTLYVLNRISTGLNHLLIDNHLNHKNYFDAYLTIKQSESPRNKNQYRSKSKSKSKSKSISSGEKKVAKTKGDFWQISLNIMRTQNKVKTLDNKGITNNSTSSSNSSRHSDVDLIGKLQDLGVEVSPIVNN